MELGLVLKQVDEIDISCTTAQTSGHTFKTNVCLTQACYLK